jgi:hypothetical protein
MTAETEHKRTSHRGGGGACSVALIVDTFDSGSSREFTGFADGMHRATGARPPHHYASKSPGHLRDVWKIRRICTVSPFTR